MSRLRLLVALSAGLLLVHAPAAAAAGPFRFPEGRHGKGELKYVNKVPVLTVEGTPEEIGEAVGALAVKPAPRVLNYPKGLLEYFSAGLLWAQAVRQGKEMVRHFPADYRKEMEAIAKTSGAGWDQVVAGNTLFDIKKMFFCSALLVEADRSATRGPLLGRNLDYPSLGYVHEYSLVTVYRPRGKRAFASVGFPGIVGCLSGINDAGLTVGVLEAFAARKGEGRFNPRGIPYALCYRTLLEECATIAEAKKRLEGMPRTTITNLVVADREGVAVFEITPKSVVLRQATKGTLACTNHFCSEVRPETQVDIARSFGRFDLLEAARALRERLTVADLHGKLDEANLGELTLQTMVFEPRALRLHLATGAPPASGRPLRTIELAALLRSR